MLARGAIRTPMAAGSSITTVTSFSAVTTPHYRKSTSRQLNGQDLFERQQGQPSTVICSHAAPTSEKNSVSVFPRRLRLVELVAVISLLLLSILYHGVWLHGNYRRTRVLTCPKPTHLILMSHGWTGTPANMDVMAEVIVERIRNDETKGGSKPPCVLIHKLSSNWGFARSFVSTSDGVDRGGDRVAEEVREIVRAYPTLTELSTIGHSLGGLYLRYAQSVLLDSTNGTIAGLNPINYVSLGTPHAGVRHTLSSAIHWFAKFTYMAWLPRQWIQWLGYGRTLEHMSISDNERLLLRMSEPETPAMKALALFKRRVLYSNARHDFFVSCCSSSLMSVCPNQHRSLHDREFPHLIGTYKSEGAIHAPSPVHKGVGDWQTDALVGDTPPREFGGLPHRLFGHEVYPHGTDEWQILWNLRQLPWEHNLVMFKGLMPSIFAHQFLVYAFKQWGYMVLGDSLEVPRHLARSLEL